MQIHTISDILKEHTFFSDMKPEYLELLAGCGSNVRFKEGDIVFRQMENADLFYVILEGKVAVDVGAADGERITIQTLSEGDVLGWSWLFAPYYWTFDARAIEPLHAIAMDAKCLRGKCEKDHELGYEMLKRFSAIIIERLQATRIQLMDIYGPKSAV